MLWVADARLAFASVGPARNGGRRVRRPGGDPARPHRGARTEADEDGAVLGLFMEGRPMHGQAGFASRENLLPLVGARLGGRDAAPPHRWSHP